MSASMEDLDFSSKSTTFDILNKRDLPLENHGAHRMPEEPCTEYKDPTEGVITDGDRMGFEPSSSRL